MVSRSPWWRRSGPWLVGLLLVHGLAFFCLILSPKALLEDRPILSYDYPYHWYHAATLPRLLGTLHRPWGWDPHHMAGHPKSTLLDGDARAWQFFAHGLSFLGRARAFNLFAILTFCLWPLAAWGAARGLGARPPNALLSAVLAAAYLWIAPWEGNPCWYLNPLFFFRSGLVSFLLLSAGFPLFVAATERFLASGRGAPWLAMTAGAALLPTVHVFAFPLLLTAAYFGLGALVRNFSFRRLGGVVAAIGLAAGANLWWIRPFLAHWKDFLPVPPEELYFTDPALTSLPAFLGGEGPRFPVLLMAAGLVGAWQLWRRRASDARVPLAASGIVLALLAALGSLAPPLLAMEPQRFFIPAVLCLLPSAAFFLERLLRAARAALIRPELLARSLALILLPMLACALLGRSVRDVVLQQRYELTTETSPRQRQVVAWLRKHTNEDARVLVEASPLGDPTPWDDSRYPLLLPLEAPGQYLGTTSNYAFIRHRYPDFADGILAGESLNTLDPITLRKLLDRYNIRWILCWSMVARHRFELSGAWFSRLVSSPPFALYAVDGRPSWFHRGRGRVKASLGRIEVTDYVGPKDCVLRYRHTPSLRLLGPGRLERADFPPDPVGFIRVVDAPANFVIVDGAMP